MEQSRPNEMQSRCGAQERERAHDARDLYIKAACNIISVHFNNESECSKQQHLKWSSDITCNSSHPSFILLSPVLNKQKSLRVSGGLGKGHRPKMGQKHNRFIVLLGGQEQLPGNQ